MNGQLRVWRAIGRDGRVIAETRCAAGAETARLSMVIDRDPAAAPEGWYLAEGRDLSRGCVCDGYGRHSRGCEINVRQLAAYDARGQELARS